MKITAAVLVMCGLALVGCGEDESHGSVVTGGTNGTNPSLNGGGSDAGATTGGPTTGTNTTGVGPTTTTGGATTGGTAATTGTNTPINGLGGDGPTCERKVIKPKIQAPNMLIVLDRSSSMQQNGNNRWMGSVDAINTVTASLETYVRFGLMTFPSDDPNGGGGGPFGGGFSCVAGGLRVPMEIQNAMPIAEHLAGTMPNGATPTSTTLEAALQVLNENPVRDDEGFILPAYVMLVTDGDPNCVSPDSIPGQPDMMAQDASVAAIEALLAAGVQTYVIGYQTAGTAAVPVLDRMAAAGGTGDMAHRSVNNGDDLVMEFQSIAAAAVPCEFVLQEEVDPTRVRLTVDGADGVYGTDWTIAADNRTIQLLGSTCDALQVGATIDTTVECEVVTPL